MFKKIASPHSNIEQSDGIPALDRDRNLFLCRRDAAIVKGPELSAGALPYVGAVDPKDQGIVDIAKKEWEVYCSACSSINHSH